MATAGVGSMIAHGASIQQPGFNRAQALSKRSGIPARIALGQDALPHDFLLRGIHRDPVRNLGHGTAAAATDFVEGGRAYRDAGCVGAYRSPDRTYRSPDRAYRSPDRTYLRLGRTLRVRRRRLSVLVRHRACPSLRGPVFPWSRYCVRRSRRRPGRPRRRARCCLRAAAAGSHTARGW